MADIVVTAANVKPYDDATTTTGVATETITAGQVVFRDTMGRLALADADLEASANVLGIALCGASRLQPLVAQTGGHIDVGGTVAIGQTYAVSATAGGIALESDPTAGDYIYIIGVGIAANKLKLGFVRATEPHA